MQALAFLDSLFITWQCELSTSWCILSGVTSDILWQPPTVFMSNFVCLVCVRMFMSTGCVVGSHTCRLCRRLAHARCPFNCYRRINLFLIHYTVICSAFTITDSESACSGVGAFTRSSTYMTHPIFNTNQSEHEMLRYLKKLENRCAPASRSFPMYQSCWLR